MKFHRGMVNCDCTFTQKKEGHIGLEQHENEKNCSQLQAIAN